MNLNGEYGAFPLIEPADDTVSVGRGLTKRESLRRWLCRGSWLLIPKNGNPLLSMPPVGVALVVTFWPRVEVDRDRRDWK